MVRQKHQISAQFKRAAKGEEERESGNKALHPRKKGQGSRGAAKTAILGGSGDSNFVFTQKIQIDLILKNRDNSTKVYKDNIDKIDNHVP